MSKVLKNKTWQIVIPSMQKDVSSHGYVNMIYNKAIAVIWVALYIVLGAGSPLLYEFCPDPLKS